jgi:hypothetical protein
MSNEKKPSGNGYDEDLDIEIKDVLGDAPRVAPFNASPYFEKLAMIMPLQGSRLDWDRVPNARVAFTPIGEQQTADFETFFKQAVLDFSLTQDVIHLSDGGPELARRLPMSEMVKTLDPFLSIPHHHFFIDDNFSWCMVFTFEGEMGFGFIPARAAGDKGLPVLERRKLWQRRR